MMCSSSVKLVSTMTWVEGLTSLTPRVAAMPSISGISRSISTTSGFSAAGAFHGLTAVACFADDLDLTAQVQVGAQPFAHHGVIVDDQHTDRVNGHACLLRVRPAVRPDQAGPPAAAGSAWILPDRVAAPSRCTLQ